MAKWVLAVTLALGLSCGQGPWEHRAECYEMVASAEQCTSYKTLEEALAGVSEEFERKKLIALFKLFGPTPAPMCKARGIDDFGWWKKRKLKACEKLLEDFPKT